MTKFNKNPAKYISGQAKAHENYNNALSQTLSELRSRLNSLKQAEMDLERQAHLAAPGQEKELYRMGRWFTIIMGLPTSLVTLSTPEGRMKTSIRKAEQAETAYIQMRSVIETGRTFLLALGEQHRNQLSSESRPQLGKCIQLAGSIAYSYSLCASVSRNSASSSHAMYNLLYTRGS